MFTIIVKISLPIIYLVKLKVTWPSECLKSPDFPLKYLPARPVSKLSVWQFDGIPEGFFVDVVDVCAFYEKVNFGKTIIIIIRLLCRCAAVPSHEAYIAHTAHPVLCTHFGFKKGIRAVSCPYPTPW